MTVTKRSETNLGGRHITDTFITNEGYEVSVTTSATTNKKYRTSVSECTVGLYADGTVASRSTTIFVDFFKTVAQSTGYQRYNLKDLKAFHAISALDAQPLIDQLLVKGKANSNLPESERIAS